MELAGKSAVITGASSGLGKALAERLLAEGMKVAVCAPDAGGLADLASRPGVIAVPADVRKEAEMGKLAELAVREFGRIDVWVNNAGIWLPHLPIEETDAERAHDLMEVNYFGTFYGSRQALIRMKAQSGGTIVNIISVRAKGQVLPDTSAYTASKFAAEGFTEVLRMEAAPAGIRVIGVYTSRMQTGLFGKEKPADYSEYLPPEKVAEKIADNLKLAEPLEELVITASP